MPITRLRRGDRNEDGEPANWSIKTMIFFAHRLKAQVTIRRIDGAVLEFDRLVTLDEFLAAMSPAKFAELGCTIEHLEDREQGGAS